MKSHVRMVLLAGLLAVAAGALFSGGCAAVDDKTLSYLPEYKAKELKVWSTNHSIVFDARFHSLETCPFLSYLPAASTLRGQQRADWAWKFYGAKHREEDHCNCDTLIAAP